MKVLEPAILSQNWDRKGRLAGSDRVAVVGCAVLETEVEALLAGAGHVVAYRKLAQGLHEDPSALRAALRGVIDELERGTSAETIVLVYGLCSRGIEGLSCRRCRLVVARAHDCITLLLGSRARYASYVARHPGTYWYSPGWNRHHVPPGPERYARLRADYAARYGEERAGYLMEAEQRWFGVYTRATYVHLTVGATEGDRRETRRCADWLGWDYDEQAGDPGLLRRLVYGPWDEEDFLVLEPGQSVRFAADDRVVEAVGGGVSEGCGS